MFGIKVNEEFTFCFFNEEMMKDFTRGDFLLFSYFSIDLLLWKQLGLWFTCEKVTKGLVVVALDTQRENGPAALCWVTQLLAAFWLKKKKKSGNQGALTIVKVKFIVCLFYAVQAESN
jgi:hypothetical protein